MSNLDLVNSTLKEKARKVTNLTRDDFDLAVNKITDTDVLKEVYLTVYMKDLSERIKIVQARAKSIGFKLD